MFPQKYIFAFCVVHIYTEVSERLEKEKGFNRQQHTHFQLFSEDRPLPQCRTVPAPVFELKLTLVDAHLGPLSDDDNGIGATLADNPLSRGQTGDLVTDYART